MSKKFLALCSAAIAFATASLTADFAIKEGDRVVFLGDSITEQRLYTTYIEAYALSRHPDWKLTFRNVGWGGDTSWLRQRAHPEESKLFAADAVAQQAMVEDSVKRGLDRDVLPLKPTFVTVKFGMNDHSYQLFRPDIFGAYIRSQTEINKVLSANGARVAFLTPQPIEDKRPDPDKDVRNQSLRKFSDGLKEVASKGNAAFADQFDPFMAIMLAERAKNPQAFIGGGDAVHPGPSGQTVMAWAVLKALGASAEVSTATVDAKAASLVGTHCRLSNLAVAKDSIAFDRLDKALPLPIDERAEPALKIAPILDELSRYELRVTGLTAGNYNITVDGVAMMQTDAESLAKGVNLANRPGPITQQTRQLLDLIVKKNNSYFNRWRSVQLHAFPAWAQGPEVEARRAIETKRLDDEVAATESQIDSARKPKSHRFEIKPAA